MLSQRHGPLGVCGDLALPLTQLEFPTATGPLRDLARGLLSHGLQFGDQALLPTQDLPSLTATYPHRELMARGLLNPWDMDWAMLMVLLPESTLTPPVSPTAV